jgi:hypothetical protein
MVRHSQPMRALLKRHGRCAPAAIQVRSVPLQACVEAVVGGNCSRRPALARARRPARVLYLPHPGG